MQKYCNTAENHKKTTQKLQKTQEKTLKKVNKMRKMLCKIHKNTSPHGSIPPVLPQKTTANCKNLP